MELLDNVRKLEGNAEKRVAKSSRDAEHQILEYRESIKAEIEAKRKKDVKRLESDLLSVKKKADEEASVLLRDSENKLKTLKSSATKNEAEAVDYILGRLTE